MLACLRYLTVTRTHIQLQNPEDRPTFETLQWRLEDFFVDTGQSYTEASNVM